jgi:hypothetical protein
MESAIHSQTRERPTGQDQTHWSDTRSRRKETDVGIHVSSPLQICLTHFSPSLVSLRSLSTDYLVINKNPRNKSSFVRHATAQSAAQNVSGRSFRPGISVGTAAAAGLGEVGSVALATSSRGPPSMAELVAPQSPGEMQHTGLKRQTAAQRPPPGITPQSSPRATTPPPAAMPVLELEAQPQQRRNASAAAKTAVSASLAHRRELSKSSGNFRHGAM